VINQHGAVKLTYDYILATCKMSSRSMQPAQVSLIVGSAAAGAAVCALVMTLLSKEPEIASSKTGKRDPETDFENAHGVVWRSIGGAMQASQLYLGDRLKLYSTLRDLCAVDGSSVSAPELARASNLKVLSFICKPRNSKHTIPDTSISSYNRVSISSNTV